MFSFSFHLELEELHNADRFCEGKTIATIMTTKLRLRHIIITVICSEIHSDFDVIHWWKFLKGVLPSGASSTTNL